MVTGVKFRYEQKPIPIEINGYIYKGIKHKEEELSLACDNEEEINRLIESSKAATPVIMKIDEVTLNVYLIKISIHYSPCGNKPIARIQWREVIPY
jgi:hypothetical protein